MRKLRMIDLFAGIGGFAYAARLTGHIETITHIEKDPNAQRVLREQFSRGTLREDIRDYHPLYRRADLFTIGFPCTNTSNAGNRTGLTGEESGLWFEALRCVIEGDPPFIVIENPPGLIDRGLRDVLGGLRMAGYSWEDPTLLSGAMLGSPHLRERLFIIAYADCLSWQKHPQRWSDQVRGLVKGKRDCAAWPQFSASDDGVTVRLPDGVDRDIISVPKGQKGRLNSRILFGRSVMPDVAEIPLRRVLTLADCVDLEEWY